MYSEWAEELNLNSVSLKIVLLSFIEVFNCNNNCKHCSYLNSKQSVERHEEEEEDGDVVDLLARPLEDLVDPGLWHRKL